MLPLCRLRQAHPTEDSSNSNQEGHRVGSSNRKTEGKVRPKMMAVAVFLLLLLLLLLLVAIQRGGPGMWSGKCASLA